MKIIELRNVSKTFKQNIIFEQINVVFEKGKIYGITGTNGSGKSVLFKIICHFVKPDSGSVHIHSDFFPKGNDFPQNFGILINRPGYIAGLTGYDNLKRWADIQGKIKREDIIHAMEQVGIDHTLKQKMKDYSLGMKQKIALAQAIMENQQVLILDEPFNALDSDSVERIRQLLQQFKQEGRTILLTSHQKEDIDLLCDEIYHVNQHKLERTR